MPQFIGSAEAPAIAGHIFVNRSTGWIRLPACEVRANGSQPDDELTYCCARLEINGMVEASNSSIKASGGSFFKFQGAQCSPGDRKLIDTVIIVANAQKFRGDYGRF